MGTDPGDWTDPEVDGSRDPEGRYANYFSVGYNAVEILLDFGQFYPETGAPRIHTRIVTTPIYARALLDTLRTSLEGYEASYGLIPREGQGP